MERMLQSYLKMLVDASLQRTLQVRGAQASKALDFYRDVLEFNVAPLTVFKH